MIKYYIPGLDKFFIAAALFAISYFLFKKIIKKESTQRSEIKIVSIVPLGQKEKLIVCQIQHKKFIMGVTQHNITHLHTFESAELDQVGSAEIPKNPYTPYFT